MKKFMNFHLVVDVFHDTIAPPPNENKRFFKKQGVFYLMDFLWGSLKFVGYFNWIPAPITVVTTWVSIRIQTTFVNLILTYDFGYIPEI